MGFASYRSYLESGLWKSIRRRVLVRDRFLCRLCEAPAVLVHHVNYSWWALLGRDVACMYSMCVSCHAAVEFEGDSKLSVRQARNRLRKLLRAKSERSDRDKVAAEYLSDQEEHMRSIRCR